jgi:hypothetical protein
MRATIAAIALLGAISLTSSVANALVICEKTDQDTIRRKGLALYCVPEQIKVQHDSECVAFGLERDTDGYFSCRMFMAEQFREAEVFKLLQGKTAEEVGQR